MSRSEVLALYKLLLRQSCSFPNYMYRNYAVEKVRWSFRENKGEKDLSRISSLIAEARESLELIHRQVIIGELYKSPHLIIEGSKK